MLLDCDWLILTSALQKSLKTLIRTNVIRRKLNEIK